MSRIAKVGVAVLVFILTIIGLYFKAPKHEIVTKRTNVFVIDKPFREVQGSLSGNNFTKDILKANNAQLIRQEVLDKDFDLRRPLRKDRYWHYRSKIASDVIFRNGGMGNSARAVLIQDLDVRQDGITSKTTLDRPLPVGITHITSHVEIFPCPYNPNQTLVRAYFYMRLHRRIPAFMRPYAEDQMNQRANKSVVVFESTLRQAANNTPRFPFLRRLPKESQNATNSSKIR